MTHNQLRQLLVQAGLVQRTGSDFEGTWRYTYYRPTRQAWLYGLYREVVCDTEVLYAFPDLNPTALLYPVSNERVIVVSVKAARVAEGLRLLGDGPIYPTGNCTVLEPGP